MCINLRLTLYLSTTKTNTNKSSIPHFYFKIFYFSSTIIRERIEATESELNDSLFFTELDDFDTEEGDYDEEENSLII